MALTTIRISDGDGRHPTDLLFDTDTLKVQKQWLIDQDDPRATGLLHFLDAFQDILVDELGHDENQIFHLINEA